MKTIWRRREYKLTNACLSYYQLIRLNAKFSFVVFLAFSCLFAVSHPTAAATIQSNTWCLAWHTVAEPSGGYTAVQTFLRSPLPPGQKVASKEDFDEHFQKPPNVQMSVRLHTGHNTTNGAQLMIKYFRGPIYTSTNFLSPWKVSAASKENWVTVVSTTDNTRLVAGVDNGPIYSSTNSGVTWETINNPGEHSLLITSGDGECGVFAVQTILTNEQPASAVPASNWYAVASGSDGSGLIVSGSDSPSPPVLSISIFGNQVIIAWPSSVAGYALQENSDLTTTNWTDVIVAPSVFNGFNRVILPADTPHNFYRLKMVQVELRLPSLKLGYLSPSPSARHLCRNQSKIFSSSVRRGIFRLFA